MASFLETDLSYERSGKRVLFTVTSKVRFEPQEKGHKWMFEIVLMEADPLRDDHLYTKRHYIEAEAEEMVLRFTEDLGWAQVDTEWGAEEVYANLRIAPLDAPANMMADEAKTNTVSVDV